MPRQIKPHWCARDKAWLVPLGEISEVTGRRRYVVLRDTEGQKIGYRDINGKIKALRRLEERASSGLTVRELIIDYLNWHKDRGSRAATVADYEFHLSKFGLFEYQGVRYCDRPASSITLRDLARVRESMEERGCQSGYIRHLYSAVLACWRWASRPIEGRVPERLLTSNPLEGAERPRKGQARKLVIPWPTIIKLRQFAWSRAEKVKQPNIAKVWRKVWMLDLIAETGCRPGEACALEWSWVHEKERYILIPATAHKSGWRHGDDRIIGLTSKMSSILSAMRPDHPEAWPTWVFALPGQQKPSRGRLDHWFADLREAAIESGIPIPPTMTLYSLRHSLVTQARQGGISYQDLAAHMGHSEQVAEQIYSHLDPDFIRTQFDRMHAARTKPSSAE